MAYLNTRADGTSAVLPLGNARLGGLGWAVKTPVSKEGHEAITRTAFAGGRIPFKVGDRPMGKTLTPAEQTEIIEGNRSTDLGWKGTGLLFAFNKDEQKRHALRREYDQSQKDALRDILGSIRKQHADILTERDPRKRLRRIGQSLHLIQDSFSRGHIDRNSASNWCIRYIRNYGKGGAPIIGTDREHRVPTDDRDKLPPGGASASPEARQAAAFSRRYLQIVFKALYGKDRADPIAAREAATEFAGFLAGLFRACFTS